MELQTYILFFFQIIGVYFGVINLEKTQGISRATFNIKTLLQIFYTGIIVMPLLEESLFRGVLKQYLSDYPYSDYVNGLIFGLVHIQNYSFHHNIFFTLLQIISASYGGYYLVQFESFLSAYLVHAYYNLVAIGGSLILYYLKHKNE